jgi:hypothetical protein
MLYGVSISRPRAYQMQKQEAKKLTHGMETIRECKHSSTHPWLWQWAEVSGERLTAGEGTSSAFEAGCDPKTVWTLWISRATIQENNASFWAAFKTVDQVTPAKRFRISGVETGRLVWPAMTEFRLVMKAKLSEHVINPATNRTPPSHLGGKVGTPAVLPVPIPPRCY